MNAVAANPSPGFFRKSWNTLNSALAVGLILALIGLAVQSYQAREAANQSSNLVRVGEFSANAEATDRAVVRFFNAAAEGRNLKDSRLKVDEALVDHSIKVESLRDVLGPEQTEEYLRAIEMLQEQIASTNDARNAGPNVTALAHVIELRRSMVERARNGS